ncbi:MAG: hypothetical protein ACLFPU_09045 [Dehalococcoidia bacterium]
MNKWITINEHKSHGIKAKAFRSEKAPIEGRFTLGIFFGTFESRGLVSSTLLNQGSCTHSLVVFFQEAQDTDLRKRFDETLWGQFRDPAD